MGGGEVARECLRADLIDELYLGIVPVLLGQGIPLFPSGFPQRNFSLVENKTFSRGLIALKYSRARGTDKVARRTRPKSTRSVNPRSPEPPGLPKPQVARSNRAGVILKNGC
jgi:hypothetical protein